MKNRDILLDVIGDVDEKLIPELTAPKKKKNIIKWTALGGICAAAAACAILLPKINKGSSVPLNSASQIIYDETKTGTEKINADVVFGSMGYEGVMAYDISELDTPSPWTSDMTLSSLPVYRNLANQSGENSYAVGAVYLSEEKMNEIAKNAASALKIKINDTKATYVRDFVQGGISDDIMNSVYSLEARCSNNITLTVYGDGKVKAEFSSRSLPDKYSFSYSNTSSAEAEKTLRYLSKEYAELLGYSSPVCYSYADRTYSGAESRSYYVFNKTGDTVQDILNFSLSYAEFAPDDNGDLMCIWLYNPSYTSEYMGNYPIITEKNAAELLINGYYFSTVPADFLKNGKITDSDISKSELIYRNNGEEYYQPYYKFYIELDASKLNMADGLKDYGIFYVPAVNSEYLNDFTPDITFEVNMPESSAKAVHIPAIELPETSDTANMDMIGLVVYQGRIYTQAYTYTGNEAEGIKHLIGEHLGTAKGNIDEWSSQDEYATEFASSVSGEVYSVKGYDTTFRICIYSEYEDENNEQKAFIQFLDDLNGIDLASGSELFEDRLHISENTEAVRFQYHDDWDWNRENFQDADISEETWKEFMSQLDSGGFVYTWNPDSSDNSIYDKNQAHLILSMTDGTTVKLRLIEGGYVGYEPLGWYFVKIPEDIFNAVYDACGGKH